MQYKNTEYGDAIVQGIIHEYDIKAAGLSVMYAEKIISKDMYDYYNSLPKEIRNIKLGMYIGEKGLSAKRNEALDKYMEKFIKENEIQDGNIMEIASDALWLFNVRRLKVREFGPVQIRLDRVASIMISWNIYRFHFDSWSGAFFIRGYKEDTQFTRKIKELLALIDSNTEQPVLYNFLHDMKADIVYGVYEFISYEKSIQFIDWLLEQIIK